MAYHTENDKPLIERSSRLRTASESGRWWDGRLERNGEWTQEGGRKWPTGTSPVILEAHMAVCERVGATAPIQVVPQK